MAKTMKKEDVLYREKIPTFDVSKVAELSGKPASGAIKSAVAEAKKAMKNGTMKDGEGKIGLIEGHLFLRIKAGDSHEDDFLILKNFTPPGQGPVRSNEYLRRAQEYVTTFDDLYDQLNAGEKEVKIRYSQLQEILTEIRDVVGEAQRGTPTTNPGERAKSLLKQAMTIAAEAKRIFDEECHIPFDANRTLKPPADIDPKDLQTKTTYNIEWRAKYGRAKENHKLALSCIELIRAEAKNAQSFQNNPGNEEKTYIAMAKELARLSELERTASKDVWGLVRPEVVEGKIRRVLGEMRSDSAETRAQTMDAYLLGAASDVKQLQAGYKNLMQHITKVDDIVKRLGEVPKKYSKLSDIASSVKTIAGVKKELSTYAKQSEGYLKNALKAYEALKKETTRI